MESKYATKNCFFMKMNDSVDPTYFTLIAQELRTISRLQSFFSAHRILARFQLTERQNSFKCCGSLKIYKLNYGHKISANEMANNIPFLEGGIKLNPLQ